MLSFLFVLGASFTGQCEICKTVAEVGIDLLIAQIKKPEVEQKVEAACQKLMPKALKGLCNQIPYDKLVDYLENGKTATTACTLVKLCKKVSTNSLRRHVVSNAAPTFKDETSPQWAVSWEEAI